MNKRQIEIMKQKVSYSQSRGEYRGVFTPVEILFLVDELEVGSDSWDVNIRDVAESRKSRGDCAPRHYKFLGSEKLRHFLQV